MLLSPKAVERLKSVTAVNYYPYITHAQRNESARVFLTEVGRLLDQKAESTIKHAIDLYIKGDIPYEQYLECIEEVGKEEEVRGAAYGGTYARNRVFEFAQKILDREHDRVYELSLVDAKKQHEQERQKAEEAMQLIVQHAIAQIETAAQQQAEEKNTHTKDLQELAEQYLEEIKGIQQKYGEKLHQKQDQFIQDTRTEIKQIVSDQLQDERDKQEQAIHEQEEARPAREAARTALQHVHQLEKKIQAYRRRKNGLIGLGVILFIGLIILLLFFPLPQWAIVLLLAVIALIIIIIWFWKSPVPEDTLALDQKQIALYQTRGGDYTSLNDEERSALLVQRVFHSSLPR